MALNIRQNLIMATLMTIPYFILEGLQKNQIKKCKMNEEGGGWWVWVCLRGEVGGPYTFISALSNLTD